MSFAVRAALTAAALATFAAPVAEARVAADAAAAKPKPFGVKSLTAPRSVRAGSTFRVRGSATLLRPRRAGTARLTFTVRRVRPARSWRLAVRGTPRVRLSRRSRVRRFSLRLTVPRSVPSGRYRLRACVRRGNQRAGCRSRALRVTRRSPGGPTTPPGPGPGPGPGQPPTGGPEALQSLRAPLTGENFYFVMADRFAQGSPANDDGDPAQALDPADYDTHGFQPSHKGYYHGGDLKGMLDKIEYIQDLGTTAIWLTPSFKNKPVQDNGGNPSAGYHGYWITDFTQIDPHLGTNDDLAALVEAAHARGMKVFFDIITNHTADVISYEQKPGGPAPFDYVSKDQVPYKTAAGNAFDDRDFAGAGGFPALDPATSFPYTPVNPAGSETPGNVNHKVPEWLNDVTLYHNRGNTTFVGENSQYGDFFGLDDLFTEDQRVVDGMKDIYKQWITDFKIDGFRIDTMKHVNDEFWQDFAPDVLAHAKAEGKSEFLMFGEVFDTTKTYTSHFTTQAKVQAVIDFPFQAAAQRFAAASGPTSALRDFFVGDDWYTDADSNVYQLPTFLGNHDMGRIGRFVQQANAGATDDEIFDRDRLAHELMYFSRGNPVVYYGDEQGFTGDGGDQDARQDMFPSQVASYNDDDLIATDSTTAVENFDTSHPLYTAIRSLATVTKAHPALRNGPQQSRYSTEGAGIYASSRLDRAGGREYVVALNNSEQEQTARVPTSAGRRAGFSRVYGDGAATGKTDAGRRLSVTVPPLSTVVYRSDAAIPLSPAAPEIAVEPLPEGGEARDRAEVRAFVDGNSFYDVTFQAKVGDGEWTTIGTDDNDPYRVFHDVAGIAPGTTVQYRATVLDNAGHTRTSDPEQIQVAEPAIALTAPPQGGRVSGSVTLAAEVTPDDSDNSVRFERSAGGGAFTTVGTDSSQPAYTVSDDVSSLAPGTPVEYRAVLTSAPGHTVTSAVRAVTAVESVTTATIHYNRPARGYVDWGLHLFGAALAPGEATAAWTNATPFEGTDAYGALHEIDIAGDEQRVGFIVHGRPPGGNPETKDPNNSPDRFFTPIDHPEIWLKQGDATIYFSPPA